MQKLKNRVYNRNRNGNEQISKPVIFAQSVRKIELTNILTHESKTAFLSIKKLSRFLQNVQMNVWAHACFLSWCNRFTTRYEVSNFCPFGLNCQNTVLKGQV